MKPFHLAIPTHDLQKAKDFYESLGCSVGRSGVNFIICKFFDHQLVCHLDHSPRTEMIRMYPRHFGIVLGSCDEFETLYTRAKESRLTFFEDRFIRYGGKPEEHETFFLKDPTDNLVEFKYYRNPSFIFGSLS